MPLPRTVLAPAVRARLAVVLLLAAAPAAAQVPGKEAPAMEHGSGHDMPKAMTTGPENPADKAFMDAMGTMMIGMHQSLPTGDTDADFVRLMVPHHQSAVDMAKAELQYGGDAELKALAKSIIDDQDREIAMMKAWQAKHLK